MNESRTEKLKQGRKEKRKRNEYISTCIYMLHFINFNNTSYNLKLIYKSKSENYPFKHVL